MPSSRDQNGRNQSDGERLQKFLASAGIGSRRECEEYIRAGRVTVDGEEVRELGTTVDPETQDVYLDGERIRARPKRYYLVNKPRGCLCTNRDPSGRPRVIDLFPKSSERLFTVGRLDENSEGLLLVTNDGDLANRLAHPRYQVQRTYRVQVAGKPTAETLKKLRQGMHFSDGKFRADRVRRLKSKGKSTYLELALTEGRNREIRRMLARLGHKVMHLQRVGFGPLKLGRLQTGRYRRLKPAEVKSLRRLLENPRSSKTKRAPRRKTGKSKRRKQASAR